MGLADDVTAVRRTLVRIALEHQRRGPGEPRDDLLECVAQQEREARRLRRRDLIAILLLQRADLLLMLDRVQEAVPVLEEVGPTLQGLRQDDLRVRALARLAEAHARIPDWHRVSCICDEGIALVE